MVSFSFLTDLHGDEQNPRCVDAALGWVEDWEPQLRIFGGDLFDFRALRKGADAEDKAAALSEDVRQGLGFLRRYRPQVILLGNHDDRAWKLRESRNGALAYAAEKMVEEFGELCSDIGAKVYPYDFEDGVYRLGEVSFIHGFEHSAAGLAREAGAYGTRYVVQGHTHREEIVPFGVNRLFTSPALTTLKMEWNRSKTHVRKHSNGWMAGEADPRRGGSVYVTAAREVRKNEWRIAL